MPSKTDLEVWGLAAKVVRMDAEIGALWDIVTKVMGVHPKVKDPRQMTLIEERPAPPPLREHRSTRKSRTPALPNPGPE